MRKVELGVQLGDAETIALHKKACRLLEEPGGQKILREIDAFDELAHSDKGWVSPLKGKRAYTTNDYQKHPEKFSIAEFYPAVYFVTDDLLLTSDDAFTHRTRLEDKIAKEMPDLYVRLQNLEIRVVLGDTFKIKGTDIQFFAVKGEPTLQYKETKGIVARQLAKHGMLVLFWGADTEWEREQLKRPEFARYADYKKRCDEARSRSRLFAEWGDILDAFGGHSPVGPEERYKWTIISPI